MNDAARKIVKEEALKSLQTYLATGLAGFLQKGIDRVRALDVNPEGCLNCGREGIEHLIRHVNAYC